VVFAGAGRFLAGIGEQTGPHHPAQGLPEPGIRIIVANVGRRHDDPWASRGVQTHLDWDDDNACHRAHARPRLIKIWKVEASCCQVPPNHA